MRKCAAYIRVSKGELQQGTSIINQKEFLIQKAEQNNLEIVAFYIDTKTGTNKKRSEFQRMIKDAEEKKFSVLITKSGSRLARNGGLAYELRNFLESLDIDLIAFDGSINTITGEVSRFGLDAWQSERIKAALKTRAELGLFNGSIAPYGYECINSKFFIRDDDTPKVVKRIFSEYINGKGIDTIARHLFNEDIPTPSMIAGKSNSNNKWHGTTIKKY